MKLRVVGKLVTLSLLVSSFAWGQSDPIQLNSPVTSSDPSSTNDSGTDINLQGQVPRIEFDSMRYNFGDIYRGTVLTHAFSFQNTGNGVLILNSLHATCGCLNTKILSKDGITPQNTFKPGESGLIRVDFDSSQFTGNVVRSITMETNMGSSFPTVTVTLTANVLQELVATPALLYLGKIDKNEEKTYNIKLNLSQRAKLTNSVDIVDTSKQLKEQIEHSIVAKNLSDKILNVQDPLQMVAIESTQPSLEATLLPSKDKNTQIIQVKVHKTLPIGPLNSKLVVWNNSTYYKNFQIPIVGEVTGHVNYSAKYVEFGVVSDQKSQERVITYSSSQKDFTITSVKINLRRVPGMKSLRDSELFVIKKETVKLKNRNASDVKVAYQLHFRLIFPKLLNNNQSLESTSAINVSGNFLVKTNDPDYKEISVPFFGVLRKGAL